MTYRPHRDERFEYIDEIVEFIEDNQCRVCRFRKDDEYPMCFEIEALLLVEEPVSALDDKGAAGIVCSKFKQGDPLPPEDPHQLRLSI